MGSPLRNSGRAIARRASGRWLVAGMLGVVAAIAGGISVAGRAEAADLGADSASSPFSQASRNSIRRLQQAEPLIAAGRFAEAIAALHDAADRDGDFFLPSSDGSGQVKRTVRSTAQDLLGHMPKQGRDLYQLQFGPQARRMLDEAVAQRDVQRVAEVVRRFFHTEAGYEAAFVLGVDALDRGNPAAGAIVLSGLLEDCPDRARFEPALSLLASTCWLQVGEPDRARQTLRQLKDVHNRDSLRIGGESVDLFAKDDDEITWLEGLGVSRTVALADEVTEWAVHRGNSARSAVTDASRPLLSLFWRVPTTVDPKLEGLIERLREQQRQQEETLLPTLHPLVVDGMVLMRSVTNLLAVDLATGKRVWEVPVADPFAEIFEVLGELDAGSGFSQVQPLLEQSLRMRLWGDATYGTLSSDGRSVFSIEGLGLPIGFPVQRQILFGRQPAGASSASFNRLTAHDVKFGKIRWQLGGSPGESSDPMAGSFFLGPPLPLDGVLYVLAETKGEVRLHALDGEEGRLLWSQSLADVDRDILNDPLRRLAGVSPSAHGGVLVCPTSNQSVVAIDLATRSLLWGFSYDSQLNVNTPQEFMRGSRSVFSADPLKRSCDSSLILDSGRVVFAPVDSAYLYCLRLVDGQLSWRGERDDSLYVACVHQGAVVLVGEQSVKAIRLDDGLPAWEDRTASYPNGSVPSGAGFVSQGHYYVPLDSGEVMAVDLASGRVEELPSRRKGSVPGNLICYQGQVVSQRADSVEAFHQIDSLRRQVDKRLADQPDDAISLVLLGEMLWDEGDLSGAIISLRRSFDRSPQARTRELLLRMLLQGLMEDFAAYRDRADEIQRLIEDPMDQAELLRLMATGLSESGEYDGAFRTYLELIDLDREHPGMVEAEASLSLRRDRWIHGRLADLRDRVPPGVREQIDDEMTRRWEELRPRESRSGLEQFLAYFGGLRVADEARQELARLCRRDKRVLQLELLSRAWRGSEDAEVQGAALSQLAEAMRESGAGRDAVLCYRELEARFADVVCDGDETGRTLALRGREDERLAPWFDARAEWPAGAVVSDVQTPSRPSASAYGIQTIEIEGDASGLFREVTVEHRQSPNVLIARDEFGRRLWQLSLESLARRENAAVYGRGIAHLHACDHLLLLSIGGQLVALDPLRIESGSPVVLWTQDMGDSLVERLRRQQMRGNMVPIPGMGPGMGRGFSSNGVLDGRYRVAASAEAVCFRRFRSCVAVDPMTGEELWIREDIDPDAILFGDEDYLFLVPPDEGAATVLRTRDGAFLGTRTVPRSRLAIIGRTVLVWRVVDGQGTLQCRVLEGVAEEEKPEWSIGDIAADARVCLVGQEAIGLCEPRGRFLLVDIETGRKIIDQEIQRERRIDKIAVYPMGDGYLLNVITGSIVGSRVRRVYALQGVGSEQIGRAMVYAFDAGGEPLWASPREIENQYLPDGQPSRLPSLLFASLVREQNTGGSQTSLLFLDKRTGRLVFRNELSGHSTAYELTGDPDTATVTLQLQQHTVTLRCTEEPIPPEGEVVEEEPKEQGFWDSFRRILSGDISLRIKEEIEAEIEEIELEADPFGDDPFAE